MMRTSDRGELLAVVSGAPRIVFDLDGTLYDTRDFERPALADVADWLRGLSGHPLNGLEQDLWLRRESDRHRPRLFDDLLTSYGLPVAWGRECAQRFHGYPGTELTRAEHLGSELDQLRAAGACLALVSNGKPALQQRKLELLGLRDRFDLCFYCDPAEASQLKPSTWGWSRLAKWRAKLPTIYVGDDPVDAEFARAGAVDFFAFAFRSSSYED